MSENTTRNIETIKPIIVDIITITALLGDIFLSGMKGLSRTFNKYSVSTFAIIALSN
jgi:hypothetical protein